MTFRPLGQGGERVMQCGFDALLNRCLQGQGGFLPVVVEGVRRLGGSLAGGGQRPRLLFEPVQQLGDTILLLVGQLDQGSEELLGVHVDLLLPEGRPSNGSLAGYPPLRLHIEPL